MREQTRVTFVIRPIPDSVYGGFIAHYYRPLMSDIIRVELMIRYGGIYTDTDAIWVKPLTQEDRGYDAVATFDWIDWRWVVSGSRNRFKIFKQRLCCLYKPI